MAVTALQHRCVWRSRLPRPVGLLIAVGLALTSQPGPARAVDRSDSDPLSAAMVSVHGGRLTVQADDVALADVVKAIAREAGFRLHLMGDVQDPISLSLDAAPLDKGLQKLVGDNGLVIIYRPSEGGARVLEQVWVFGRADREAIVVEPDAAGDALDHVYRGLDTRGRLDRLKLVRRLSDARGRSAVGDLAAVLALETDLTVRRLAAIGLGKKGGQRAISALTDMLADSDVLLRRQAVRALAAIGTQRAAAAAQKRIADPSPKVRLEVVRALSGLRTDDAVALLHGVVVGEVDSSVRRQAVVTLSHLKVQDARWILEIAAVDSSEQVRRAAKAGLRRQP